MQVQEPKKLLFLFDVPERHFAILEGLAHGPGRTAQLVQFGLVGVEPRKDVFADKTLHVHIDFVLFMCMETLGLFWHTRKLTWTQKVQLALVAQHAAGDALAIATLIGHATLLQHHKTQGDHGQADVLTPVIETLAQKDVRRQGFEQAREAIPHRIREQDVALFESSDEEVYDTGISSETAEKIRELSSACKELQLKVTKYFEE